MAIKIFKTMEKINKYRRLERDLTYVLHFLPVVTRVQTHSGISDRILIQALVVQIQGLYI